MNINTQIMIFIFKETKTYSSELGLFLFKTDM